jgi:hypothetical protein
MTNGDPLGVALAEANDGVYMGSNNCLWLSLADELVPDPPLLREMLVETYLDDPVSLETVGYEILPIDLFPKLPNMATPELRDLCTSHIMRGGFLSASLFLELLENAARNNRLHEVLKRPVDIAFFIESEDRTKATASISFRYPEGRASSVAMVMCDHNGSHFQRLRSGSRPSKVLTSEDTSHSKPLQAVAIARFVPRNQCGALI